MKKYLDGLTVLVTSAWVGGMWAIAYIAAPVLFLSLPDKALAGMLAGKLFGVIAHMGMLCAAYLLVYDYTRHGKQVLRQHKFWVIIMMLMLILLGQFGIQPLLANLKAQALPLYVMDSPFAGQFSFWHGAASITYLAQSLLGAVLLIKSEFAQQHG